MKVGALAALAVVLMMMVVPMVAAGQQDADEEEHEIVYESTIENPEHHTTFVKDDNTYYTGYTYKIIRVQENNFSGASVGDMQVLPETSSGCTVTNYSYDAANYMMSFDFRADGPGTYNVTLAYTLTFLWVMNWEWDTYVITVEEDPSEDLPIISLKHKPATLTWDEQTNVTAYNDYGAIYVDRWYELTLVFKSETAPNIDVLSCNLGMSVRDITVDNSQYTVTFKVLFKETGLPVLKLRDYYNGHYARNVSITFPNVLDAVNITLNLNGHGSLSQTHFTYLGQPIVLPTPSVGPGETWKFLGWSKDKDGTDHQMSMTVQPDEDVTYWAHWEQCKLVYAEEIHIIANSVSFNKTIDGVTDNMEPSHSVTGFSLRLENSPFDEEGLKVDGNKIVGNLNQLVPGSYTATLIIHKNGYVDAEVTIKIDATAYQNPEVKGDLIQNHTGFYTLSINPTDAYIQEISSVKRNQVLQDEGVQYDAEIESTNSISFTGYEVGVYQVSLKIGNRGVTSSYVNLLLNVEEDTTVGTPSIDGVQVYVPDTTLPNTYHFSVRNPVNVSMITWYFYTSDGELINNASLPEVQYQFTKPGVYEYNLMYGNSNEEKWFYDTNQPIEVIYTPEKDTSGYASLNKPYEWSIVVDDSDVEVSFTPDNARDWLSPKMTVLSNEKTLITVSGTCTDPSFAALENGIIVHVMKDGTIDTGLGWTIRVLPEANVEDFEFGEQTANVVINGADLTIKDIYPSGDGITISIDYDDGQTESGASTDTFSHTYGENGYYRVKITWTWVSDGTVNQPTKTFTKYANVPGQTTAYTITYHANNDQAMGLMAPQTGKDGYTIRECLYTVADHMFLGWYDSPECDGARYVPGTYAPLHSDLELYAKWVYDGPITVTLTSELSGNDYYIRAVSTSFSDPTVTWTVTSGENLITYVTGDRTDGGAFIIKERLAAGTVSITATSDDDPTKSATIQLYICGITYLSNFDGDAARHQMFISTENTSHTFTIEPANPRFGYDFLGWTVSSMSTDVAKMPGDHVTLTSTESRTYYALWKANGQVDPDNPDTPDEPDNPDTPDEPDENPIRFSIQRDAELPNIMILSATALDNSVLTFEFVNGSIITMEQDGNTWRIKPGMSNEPGTVTVKVTSSTGLSRDLDIHVFVLEYEAKNVNPSTWVSEEETHDFAVKSTVPTKSGADFIGWAEYNHSGTPQYMYGDEDRNTVRNVGYDKVFTLYPVWSGDAKTYAVRFDDNGSIYGAVGDITSTSKNGRCVIQIPANNLEKPDYRFIRWVDESTGHVYYQGESVLLLEEKPEIRLKAVWAKESDAVRVTYRDAGSFLTAQNLIAGERPTYVPSRDGCFFAGWYKDMALTQPFTSTDVVSGGEYSLNASWILDTTSKRPVAAHQILWDLVDGVYKLSITGALDYDPAATEWQFGDGYAYTGATAAHKFAGGDQKVTAILKNKNGTTEIELSLDVQDDVRDVLKYALIAIVVAAIVGYVFYIKVRL